MFYLLEPPARVLWTDLPTSLLEKAVRQHGLDLGQIEWRTDTDKKLTPEILRAALAHGTACSRGIVVHPYVVLDVISPDQKRDMIERHRSMSPQIRAMDERAETQMKIMTEFETGKPVEGSLGWVESGERLEADLTKALEDSLAEAEKEAAKILEKPVDPDLERHWLALGGVALHN